MWGDETAAFLDFDSQMEICEISTIQIKKNGSATAMAVSVLLYVVANVVLICRICKFRHHFLGVGRALPAAKVVRGAVSGAAGSGSSWFTAGTNGKDLEGEDGMAIFAASNW